MVLSLNNDSHGTLGGDALCQSMNTNATNAAMFSSNWYSELIKIKAMYAQHAETLIPVSRCPPFPANLPNPMWAPADYPPPVLLLPEDSPELDFRSRALCPFFNGSKGMLLNTTPKDDMFLYGVSRCPTKQTGKETTLWALVGYY